MASSLLMALPSHGVGAGMRTAFRVVDSADATCSGWATAACRGSARAGPDAVGAHARERESAAEPSLWSPAARPGAPPSVGPGHHEFLHFQSPFRMIMGTTPLDFREWILVDPFYAEEMAVRRRLLQTQRDAVLADVGGEDVEAAKEELLEMLANHLPSRFPTLFQLDRSESASGSGSGTGSGYQLQNRLTGESFALDARERQGKTDPLEICAALVQEDLCLMMEDPSEPGQYRLVAGAVLFPNGWDLREKLGQRTSAIHDPVPLYADKISRRVDAFMRKLSVEKPFWRANWTITPDPSLFRPLSQEEYAGRMQRASASAGAAAESAEEGRPPLSLAEAGDCLFMRCERETFVRLPRTQAVLFTIRTLVKPLRVFEGRPELARQCIEALDDLPPEIIEYKMLGPIKDLARQFLHQCAG